MTMSDAGRSARFMGFRECPACGETLFAAERATFVYVGKVTLHWRCDACSLQFTTDADVPISSSSLATV